MPRAKAKSQQRCGFFRNGPDQKRLARFRSSADSMSAVLQSMRISAARIPKHWRAAIPPHGLPLRQAVAGLRPAMHIAGARIRSRSELRSIENVLENLFPSNRCGGCRFRSVDSPAHRNMRELKVEVIGFSHAKTVDVFASREILAKAQQALRYRRNAGKTALFFRRDTLSRLALHGGSVHGAKAKRSERSPR